MAPGRVNLIGEHTDYNGGFVLPFAIGRGVYVAAGQRSDRRVVIESARFGAASWNLGDPIDPSHWSAYVRAGLAAVASGSAAVGLDLMIDDDLPSGAGLASSAATLCVVIRAASDVAGVDLSAEALASAARRAEVQGVGVPVGPMDHMASAAATAGHCLLLDCRDLTTEQVALDPATEGLALLVMDTGTRHRLVEGEYSARRESCQRAASALGVPALRDAGLSDLDMAIDIDESDRRRARHVITENERVLATADLLRAGRLIEVGPLLFESHRSLAADFEVSTKALDLAVEAARSAGAIGSRLIGAGFGGSTISLVPEQDVEEVEAAAVEAFEAAGMTRPAFMSVSPADGARRIV
jgi:galactokinase